MTFHKWVLITILFLELVGCATTKGDWKRAQELDTVDSYRVFISKHPGSEYGLRANGRIEELRWHLAQQENTIEGYREFLFWVPRGKYSDKARLQLETLAFQQAKQSNTIGAYEDFRMTYPSSTLTSQASNEIEVLKEESSYQEFMSKRGIESASRYLRTFPRAKHAQEVLQWLQVQRVAFFVPDARFLVSLNSSREFLRLEIPTGEMRFGPGEKFEPVKKVLEAPLGHVLLYLDLKITNLGDPVRLQRQQLQFKDKSGTSFQAIYWEWTIMAGLLAMQGESFDIKDSIIINALFDVPKDNWETLSLTIGGRTVASLAQLRGK